MYMHVDAHLGILRKQIEVAQRREELGNEHPETLDATTYLLTYLLTY